ncbi:MAG: DUF4097 family beta strand repeat-containing protein [Gemmatimonadaceae bacterium]|jgi:DUF4097 and DUF4098 domain-containing protein YvlB|nr:DUF4097 family beta strand repeat-containing protein [Gemmatimonadaceae bacterium]
MPRTLIIAALLCGSALGLTAQDASRVDTTVTLSRSAIVELTLISGTIVVRGVDRDQAHVVATTSPGSSISIMSSGSQLRVGIRPFDRSWSGRSYSGRGENRFELEVPQGVRVIAATTSGDVEIRDTRGEVEVRTTSGDVIVEGARRRVDLSGTSSTMRLRDVDGSVRAGGVSGDIELIDVEGEVQGSTVSGNLVVRGGRVTDLRLETVSGDIEVGSALGGGGRYEVRAHSGDVRLGLEERTPLVLAVETFSGEINTAIPATMLPSGEPTRRRRMELAIGGATSGQSPRFVVTTFSGDIQISRVRMER